LLKFYRIGDFTTVDEFLGQVARKRGFLGPGGVGNLDAAAKAVIRDYMNGKIKFFTIPPAFEDNIEDEEMDDA
jgi:nuclear GTP-binding protein